MTNSNNKKNQKKVSKSDERIQMIENAIKYIETVIQKQDNTNKTHKKSLERLEEANNERISHNRKVDDFIMSMVQYVEKQDGVNRDQDEFNQKLWIAIENELHEKLGFFSDDTKMYTDRKVLNHEEKFLHTLVSA